MKVRGERWTRRRLLRWALGSSLLGGSLGSLVYGRWFGPENLTVEDRSIRLAGWPAKAAGLKVGLLSDMHCDCETAVDRTRRAVELLLRQQPDVVFLTGDFLTDHSVRWTPFCTEALTPLTSAPLGVYGVLGNHDYWSAGADRITRHLRRAGIRILRNDAVPLPAMDPVWIVGLDDRCERRQNAVQALRDVPPSAVKLLLIHEPDYADEAPEGFALQLSGHSHGGQIRLPGLPPLHVPRFARHYYEGLYQTARHPLYVTRGVGVTGPSFRLFCPPEVTLLRLYPAETGRGAGTGEGDGA